MQWVRASPTCRSILERFQPFSSFLKSVFENVWIFWVLVSTKNFYFFYLFFIFVTRLQNLGYVVPIVLIITLRQNSLTKIRAWGKKLRQKTKKWNILVFSCNYSNVREMSESDERGRGHLLCYSVTKRLRIPYSWLLVDGNMIAMIR